MSSLRVTPDEISGLTIFAPDFKPERGGVAEYTYQLAHGLSDVDSLDRVITTVPQPHDADYGFDVFSTRNREPGQSSRSLIQKAKNRFYSKWAFFSTLLKTSGTHVLVTWIHGLESKRFIRKCIKYDVSFSLVIHGYDIILLSRRDPSFLEKICAQADALIFNSEATRSLSTHLLSSPPQQSYILYPGINPAQLDAAPKTPASVLEDRYDVNLREKHVVLSVARLVKRKGIDIALRAIAPLLEASDSCRYVIAGTGPEYDQLKSEADELGIADKVRLTGEVSDAEKYGLLNASSLFVMPNHTRGGDDFEGFGISFIEASYFGNVVIGGRSGGAVEAISEGTSGFLLDFEEDGAEEELSDLLRRLLSDLERIDELSQKGREFVLRNFQAPELVADFARSINGE